MTKSVTHTGYAFQMIQTELVVVKNYRYAETRTETYTQLTYWL